LELLDAMLVGKLLFQECNCNMTTHLYMPESDDKFQGLIFNDNPDEILDWVDTYDPILRAHFGKPFGDEYVPFSVIPNPEDKRRRKKIDCEKIHNLLILSKHAVDVIGDLLAPHGQFLEINCPLTGYVAFHTTTVVKDAIIWEKTKYEDKIGDYGPYRTIRSNPVLKIDSVKNLNIFILQDHAFIVYISQTVKDRIEAAGLKGFLFENPPIIAI
jgi:hypothetical protein